MQYHRMLKHFNHGAQEFFGILGFTHNPILHSTDTAEFGTDTAEFSQFAETLEP